MRLEHLQSDAPPAHGGIHHSFYQILSSDQIRLSHGSQSIVWMGNTLLHRKVRNAAQDGRQWAKLISKLKSHVVEGAEKRSVLMG